MNKPTVIGRLVRMGFGLLIGCLLLAITIQCIEPWHDFPTITSSLAVFGGVGLPLAALFWPERFFPALANRWWALVSIVVMCAAALLLAFAVWAVGRWSWEFSNGPPSTIHDVEPAE